MLVPVADPDCPKPEDLLGYEHQRDLCSYTTQDHLSRDVLPTPIINQEH